MMKLKEIAARIEGELAGDGEREIARIASLKGATEDSITFVLNRSYEKHLQGLRAAAVIVGRDINKDLLEGKNYIVVKRPALAHVLVAELFEEAPVRAVGASDQAIVSQTAVVSADATVYPFVFVDNGAVIEKDVVIYPFSFIGRDVRVGEGSVIHANVSIYDRTVIGKRVIVHSGAVLGSDGFGYEWDGERHRKIPQLGILEIEDNVEIGANTCIDRASLDKTIIRKGTKIDNLAQIAHNVMVGQNSIIVSQVGIAGSSTIGNGVVLGGKAGVADHVTVGDGVMAAGGTGITKSVEPGSVISGTPHMAHRDWLKLQVYLRKLPDLFQRLEAIEKVMAHADGSDETAVPGGNSKRNEEK